MLQTAIRFSSQVRFDLIENRFSLLSSIDLRHFPGTELTELVNWLEFSSTTFNASYPNSDHYDNYGEHW